MIGYIVSSMRPKQWVKNLIIFGPLVFSKSLFVPEKLAIVTAGFALFCLTAGSVYLLNDLFDLEKDKNHPNKRLRPLPSGKLKPLYAVIAAVVFAVASLAAAFCFDTGFGIFVALYFVINLAYSSWLKNVVIVDVMSIAMGFVMRVLAGAAVINVVATPWLLMCTVLLALFLGFAKRRREIVLLSGNAEEHRRVLEHYSPYFLDQMILIVSAATVMSYALYTIAPETVDKFGTNKLIYTIPFVLYGVFRYLYLVHLKDEGGNPTRVLLTDWPLFVNIFLWLLSCLLIIEGLI